jgi:hypothetical protein
VLLDENGGFIITQSNFRLFSKKKSSGAVTSYKSKHDTMLPIPGVGSKTVTTPAGIKEDI